MGDLLLSWTKNSTFAAQYNKKMELKEHFTGKIFQLISETADELGLECYVVGGYVRDIFLNRPSKDIDVVVVGSGIEIAQAFGKKLGRGAHVSVFRNFGTAQVKYRDTEVEFVGARKESYSHDSRPHLQHHAPPSPQRTWQCRRFPAVRHRLHRADLRR